MMSNFNPNYNKLTPIEWQHKALENSTDNKSSFLPIGSLILGILAASTTGFPPTGVLIFLWGFYEAIRRNNEMARNELAIKQYGCVAHCLAEDDFRDFRAQVGDEEIIMQLNWARKHNYKLSEIAEDYLDAHPLPRQQQLRQLTEQSVEDDTRLKVINVPSIPVDVQQDEPQIDYKHQWINQILKLPFRVIGGVQGSGKSTLERWMISLLKTSGYHVIVINPETNPVMWKGVEVLSSASEINEYFEEFIQGVRDRQHEARQKGIDEDDYFDFVKQRKGRKGLTAIFLMESNTYEVHGVDPTLWANFLKQCLTNIRKWGFTACLTAHSDNQTSVASQLKGFSKLLDAQPRIDCIAKADPVTGEATSSGKGLLKMKGVSDPNPLTINLVNYPKTKKFSDGQEEEELRVEREPKINDVIHNLENSFKLEPPQISDSPEVESSTSSDYSEAAELVLSFFNNAKNKTAKSIKDLKDANKLRQLDTHALLMALRELVVKKALTFDEEGKYLKPDWQ